MLYTDGLTEPSELTGNNFELGDMLDSWYMPECVGCMKCDYCSQTIEGCDDVNIP